MDAPEGDAGASHQVQFVEADGAQDVRTRDEQGHALNIALDAIQIHRRMPADASRQLGDSLARTHRAVDIANLHNGVRVGHRNNVLPEKPAEDDSVLADLGEEGSLSSLPRCIPDA